MYKFLKFKKVPEEIKQTIVQIVVDKVTENLTDENEAKSATVNPLIPSTSFQSKTYKSFSQPHTPILPSMVSYKPRRGSF